MFIDSLKIIAPLVTQSNYDLNHKAILKVFSKQIKLPPRLLQERTDDSCRKSQQNPNKHVRNCWSSSFHIKSGLIIPPLHRETGQNWGPGETNQEIRR